MKKVNAIGPVLFFFITAALTGCATKKYDIVVDAPPRCGDVQVFRTMEIKPFQSQSRYGATLTTKLASGVAREGYIQVTRGGGQSTLTGVLNVGRIHTDSRTDSYECTKERDGKKYKTTCYSYYYTKKSVISADYTLLGNRGRNVVCSDSVREDFEKEYYSSDSSADARAKAPTDEQIVNDALEAIATKIVHAVTPHKETISVELKKGKDDNIKLGITYLENGRPDQAIAIWDQCAGRAGNPEDKAAAYYNIGVIKESRGLYRDAFGLYSKANGLIPTDKLYIQAMTRVEQLRNQTTKMRRWQQ